MSEQIIPEAAVEAAARTWFERATGCSWEDESEQTRRGHRGDIRAALEAAAPHLSSPDAASVWDEAATVLYMGNAIDPDQLQAMFKRNPYKVTT